MAGSRAGDCPRGWVRCHRQHWAASRGARGGHGRTAALHQFQTPVADNVTDPKLWTSAFVFALLGVLGTLVNFIPQTAFCLVFP